MTEYTDIDVNKTTKLFFDTENGKKVEFVKVVQCKDCKHWDTTDIHSSAFPNCRCLGTVAKLYTEPDFYCAYGERKDG